MFSENTLGKKTILIPLLTGALLLAVLAGCTRNPIQEAPQDTPVLPAVPEINGGSPEDYLDSMNGYLAALNGGGLGAEALEPLAAKALERIVAVEEGVVDSDSAEEFCRLLPETIRQAAILAEHIGSDPLFEHSAEIIESARRLTVVLPDRSSAPEVVADIVVGASGLTTATGCSERLRIRIRNGLQGLAAEAVRTTGVFETPESWLRNQDGKIVVQYDAQAVLSHAEGVRSRYLLLEESLSKALGAEDPRRIALSMTLSTPLKGTEGRTDGTLEKPLLDALKKLGFEDITLAMGTTSVGFRTDILKAGQQRLNTVQESWPATENGELPKGADERVGPPTSKGWPDNTRSLPGSRIVELSMYADGEPLAGERPMLLTLDISTVELSVLTEYQRRSLCIHRFDEKKRKWTPVGGLYDPYRKTVSVYRQNLSKYTVLSVDRTFRDVEATWSKDDILTLLNKGILRETALFQPDRGLTRDELGGWIARAYGLDADPAQLPYKDIASSNPNRRALAGLFSQGLIPAGADNRFGPKEMMTRQELAKIVSEALLKYGQYQQTAQLRGQLAAYGDREGIGSGYEDSVALVTALGIMVGDGADFRPQDIVSRAEGASVISRIRW